MYEMIELNSEGKVVDVIYASDEPIGVFLDKARTTAKVTGKHIIVVSNYDVNKNTGDTIWDSQGFLK